MFTRVLICGSRTFGYSEAEVAAFEAAMQAWVAKHGRPTTIIEGCARGADSMAEDWAAMQNVPVMHFPAQWERYGKSAGPRRNTQMLVEGKPDAVIAFSCDLANSRGTANMVSQARKAGVPVWVPIRQKGA